MKSAVIVLLVVARGDMQEPPMNALTRAAERVLGPESRIVLHEQVSPTADDDAIWLAEQMRATVVVELQWLPDRTRAHLHVHFAERAGWLERDLVFSPDEPLTERGRTLGFEIATMVPDAAPQTSTPHEAPSPSERPAPARPTFAGAQGPSLTFDVHAVEAIGGDATGFGGGAGVRWIGARGAFLRVGGETRFGRIGALDGTSLIAGPSLGAGWMSAGGRDPLHVGARLDGFAQWTQLSRTSPSERHARWVPGVDLMAELSYDTSPSTFYGALGSEYAFGDTTVRVGNADVTAIPRLRFVVELGARLRF